MSTQPTLDQAKADAFLKKVLSDTSGIATKAKAAGVSDRIRFKQLDAFAGLPEAYDVITTFDVVHDAANPHDCCEQSIRHCVQTEDTYAWKSKVLINWRRMLVPSHLSFTASASSIA